MTDYELITEQIKAIAEGVDDAVANLANAASILYNSLTEINWAGFYIMRKGELILGPFMGKPACVRIQIGRGVCGTAVAEDATQLVADVHQFAGHIACDADSRSEIVVPLHVGGEIWGVLDIDSPITGRFSPEDKEGLELFARTMENILAACQQ